VTKSLSPRMKQFLEACVNCKWHTGIASNTNSTGTALFNRGLVHFDYGAGRWVPTKEGYAYVK
jgi:hypothetical protein